MKTEQTYSIITADWTRLSRPFNCGI